MYEMHHWHFWLEHSPELMEGTSGIEGLSIVWSLRNALLASRDCEFSGGQGMNLWILGNAAGFQQRVQAQAAGRQGLL